MYKKGWLKQVVEEATKEVQSRPSYIHSLREVGSQKLKQGETKSRGIAHSEKTEISKNKK